MTTETTPIIPNMMPDTDDGPRPNPLVPVPSELIHAQIREMRLAKVQKEFLKNLKDGVDDRSGNIPKLTTSGQVEPV